jgi:putative flavoprotein involved in K+ transport
MSYGAPGQQVGVVVVGGGQAGLAVAHELAQRRVEYVVLDSEERIGDSWRGRWDGLRLFTPARYDGLPGMSFPAPAWSCPTKDEVADYLVAYATHLDLHVRSGVIVEGVCLASSGAGFVVTSSDGVRSARSVVLATGAYRTPRLPAFAQALDPVIRQLHSSQYRDPSQLLSGTALVVGASNSGAEIAMTMASGRRVILAGRDTGTMPVRPDSRAARLFDPPFWWFINHVVRDGTWIGRKALRSVRDRGGPLERVRPADLAAAGVERRFERVMGVASGRPRLEGGDVLEVANIVWCTGFRPDFEWIDLPLRLVDGWPVHRHGVVEDVPGLYLAGMPFQHTGASSLLGGVGRDAALVAEHIVRDRARAAQTRVRSPAGSEPRAVAGTDRTS